MLAYARSVLTILVFVVVPHFSQLIDACRSNDECPGESSICMGRACLEACGDWAKCKGKAICLPGGKCYCRVGFVWNRNKGCVKAECNSNEDCQRDKICEDHKCKDPCLRCGPNTFCEIYNHEPTCQCLPGYRGNPPNDCIPDNAECNSNEDCQREKVCEAHKCKDPCVDRCGPNTFCTVFDHEPKCYCNPGYQGLSPQGCTYECGVSQSKTTLIYRGTQSKPGDFPWLVALYFRNDDRWEHRCGGTLISPRIVLTAAHCVLDNNEIISTKNIKIGLGKFYRNYTRAEENSVIANVEDIVVPRHYTGPPGFELDIGLMRLTRNVRLSDFIKPACTVWTSNVTLVKGDKGYIAGWGVTENGTPSTSVLYTKLTFIEYLQCKRLIKQSSNFQMSHDKFCSVIENESHADNGDSGGGFTVVRSGRHYVVGVVSTKYDATTLVDENLQLLTGFTDLTNDEHNYWLQDYVTRLSK